MNKVSENPLKNRDLDRGVMPLVIVTTLFVTLYLVSNVMAVKVIGIANLFFFDAGTITFPLTYMLGDVLTEIWGYKTTRKVIFMTLFCNILMVICTQIGVWLPAPEELQETTDAYNHIFSCVPRIVLESLIVFLCGELSNAWFMERIKIWTKGRRLWVRTIGSSAIAYFFDSVPFVLIAFYGVVSTRELLLMIVLQYVLKFAIESIFATPLAYATIGYLKKLSLGR